MMILWLDCDAVLLELLTLQYNKLLWIIIGNVLKGVGTPEDIEDCINDVYLKLLENPKLYNYKKGAFKSFLVKVSKNKAIDRYRKLTKINFCDADEQEHSDDDNTLYSIILKENKDKVYEALNLLSEPDKEIFIRRYLFDEKPETISEKMNLDIKIISNKLFRGKIKLKSILEQ